MDHYEDEFNPDKFSDHDEDDFSDQDEEAFEYERMDLERDALDYEPVATSDDPYNYEPLDFDQIFRLLRISPGECWSIQCELITVPFPAEKDASTKPNEETGSRLDYDALSYCWGTSKAFWDIEVDGKKFAVTMNLFQALRQLRYKGRTDVWVDAICINQKNEKEKSHQVRRMADIYKGASQVMIWLGPGTPETDLLLECLNTTDSYLHTRGDLADLHEEWQKLWSPVQLQKQTEGFRHLLEHPWFRRVWIIQEVAQARSAMVMCGQKTVLTGKFAMLPRLLCIEPDPHCQQILTIMPDVRRKLSRRNPDDRGQCFWSYPDLRTLLLQFKDSKSTDPKDKIFALLGLSKEHKSNRSKLDYSKTEQKIVCDTVTSLVPYLSKQVVPQWTLLDFWKRLESLTEELLVEALRGQNFSAAQQLLELDDIDTNRFNKAAHTSSLGPHKLVEMLYSIGWINAKSSMVEERSYRIAINLLRQAEGIEPGSKLGSIDLGRRTAQVIAGATRNCEGYEFVELPRRQIPY